MDDNVHMYDSIVGYQGGGHKTERVSTCFDDKQEYESSRYQEPQCAAGNMKTTISNDKVKGPSDFHLQKNEIKQIKRWLCVLSLLVAILLLMTLASLGLAAYAFYRTGNFHIASRSQIPALSAGVDKNTELDSEEFFQFQNLITTLDTRINDTNMQVDTSQNVVSMMESRINTSDRDIANLKSTVNTRLNTINSEVVSQMTFINALKLQFNITNAAVTSLQSQLSTFVANISSLQIALKRQPRK